MKKGEKEKKINKSVIAVWLSLMNHRFLVIIMKLKWNITKHSASFRCFVVKITNQELDPAFISLFTFFTVQVSSACLPVS